MRKGNRIFHLTTWNILSVSSEFSSSLSWHYSPTREGCSGAPRGRHFPAAALPPKRWSEDNRDSLLSSPSPKHTPTQGWQASTGTPDTSVGLVHKCPASRVIPGLPPVLAQPPCLLWEARPPQIDLPTRPWGGEESGQLPLTPSPDTKILHFGSCQLVSSSDPFPISPAQYTPATGRPI